MPAPAPPPLQEIIGDHPSFEEIEEFLEQLPISEEHRSALWLWARFSPPLEHNGSGHDELKRRLSDRKQVLRPSSHARLRPKDE
jgi:hypothetical protein